ncbi:MAG: hypothetical protein ACOZAA_02550 [Pseudomonadota bacterium]
MTEPPSIASFRRDLRLADKMAPDAALTAGGSPSIVTATWRAALSRLLHRRTTTSMAYGPPGSAFLPRATLSANYPHPSVDPDQSGKRALADYNRRKAPQHDW